LQEIIKGLGSSKDPRTQKVLHKHMLEEEDGQNE